jgi:hypothetical protein
VRDAPIRTMMGAQFVLLMSTSHAFFADLYWSTLSAETRTAMRREPATRRAGARARVSPEAARCIMAAVTVAGGEKTR